MRGRSGKGGQWENTVFVLTWDDWGGYADRVATPDAEVVGDALHLGGYQVIGGSSVPLIMFGGQVFQGVENGWHSHAGIVKTIVDLSDCHRHPVADPISPSMDQGRCLLGRSTGSCRHSLFDSTDRSARSVAETDWPPPLPAVM